MTLRELRLAKGYTLEEVSNDLGIHLSTLCKYERGYTNMTDRMLAIFKAYYKVKEIDTAKNRYITLTDKITMLKEENELLKNRISRQQKEITSLIKENNILKKRRMI